MTLSLLVATDGVIYDSSLFYRGLHVLIPTLVIQISAGQVRMMHSAL